MTANADNETADVPSLRQLEARLAHIETQISQLQHAHTIYLGDHEALTRIHTGHRIYVDTRDVGICSHLMLEGRWEPWIEAGLASVVKPGMRFCDIGANFGYYTLLGAHWVGPEGRVYAFEANPEILRKLRKSVAVNGFDDRVTLFGNAVYSDHRTLEFRYTFEFSGGGSVSGGGGGPWTVHRVKVEAAPLDSLLADVSHVDVMKIDVEGAEPHVFRGARKLMARSRALSLVVEFHAASVAAVMDPRDYLQGFVADGFSLALIEPAGVTRALGVEECLATLNGRLGYLLLTRTG